MSESTGDVEAQNQPANIKIIQVTVSLQKWFRNLINKYVTVGDVKSRIITIISSVMRQRTSAANYIYSVILEIFLNNRFL